MTTENKFIKIVDEMSKAKTKTFDIINKNGQYSIGYIEWYSNWRQYCFSSYDQIVFNSDCLELIVNFLKEINIEHRKNWKQKSLNYDNK